MRGLSKSMVPTFFVVPVEVLNSLDGFKFVLKYYFALGEIFQILFSLYLHATELGFNVPFLQLATSMSLKSVTQTCGPNII